MQEISTQVFIENAIQQFSVTDLAIKELSDQYNQLEIKDIHDKEGYLAVSAARKDIKARRIELEKKRKELTADALLIQNGINTEAKRIKEMLEPIEEMLSEKEKWYELEKEKIKKEKEEAAKKVYSNRCYILRALEFDFDPSTDNFSCKYADIIINAEELKLMVDTQFSMLSEQLTQAYDTFKEQEKARLAEEEAARKKAEDERLAREKAEHEEHTLLRKQKESMERERAEIEAEKAKLEAEKRDLLAEQERLKQKIIDDEKARLQAEQDSLLAEKSKSHRITVDDPGYDPETGKDDFHKLIKDCLKETVTLTDKDGKALCDIVGFRDNLQEDEIRINGYDQGDTVDVDMGTQDITVVRFTCPNCKEKYDLSTSEISDLINLTQEA